MIYLAPWLTQTEQPASPLPCLVQKVSVRLGKLWRNPQSSLKVSGIQSGA